MLEAVGHYRIRQQIGQGAMGVVYEGWDDLLQRPVAVKSTMGPMKAVRPAAGFGAKRGRWPA